MVQPPPDKSDDIAPLPPVNDGLKLPKVAQVEPKLPVDAPVKKDK